MSHESLDQLRARARAWMADDPDPETRLELEGALGRNDETSLRERFAGRLEFGTAGLRGVLGAGSARMNRAVVIRTAAGLCAYLLAQANDAAQRGVVIGYDGRRMSRRFAEDTAEVCAGMGIRAHLFADVAPTPLLAFAVERLGCCAGVMVTASHNPPEYNGYKVYAANAAQIIPPVDRDISLAIDAVASVASVARPTLAEARALGRVLDVPDSVEGAYLDAVTALERHRVDGSRFCIAYTPLHGVGYRLTKAALALAGFTQVHVVPEQAEPDGAFPTVAFPNPEEPGAMDRVVALARRVHADLVIANDPDADRLSIAVPDAQGGYVQLTGNEVGALFGAYLLVDAPAATDARVVITTVVSSPLLAALAESTGVHYEETLTGFKWIANRAMQLAQANGPRFVFGYEEALGYSVGTVVRDKDGVGAARVFAELAAYYQQKHGRSVLEQLDEVYRRVGVFVSGQHNVTWPGIDGAERIAKVMEAFRAAPPDALVGRAVAIVRDLRTGEQRDLCTGAAAKLSLPPSNVLVYVLDDGSRITLRPSGTEPKIKYYFDVRERVAQGEPVSSARARATERLAALRSAFVALATERAA